MATIISLTSDDGSTLLQSAHRLAAWPEAVGSKEAVSQKKFSPSQRQQIEEEVGHLLDALKAESPLYRKKLALFGPHYLLKTRQATEQDVAKGSAIEAGDEVEYTELPKEVRERTVDVELTGSAAKGLFWVCYMWLASDSPSKLAVGARNGLAWPLVRQVKKVRAMQQYLGLDQPSAIEILDDDQQPAEKPAETAAGAKS